MLLRPTLVLCLQTWMVAIINAQEVCTVCFPNNCGSNVEEFSGDSALLTCSSTSDRITERRSGDGSVLLIDNQDSRYNEDNNLLRISGLVAGDEGVYICAPSGEEICLVVRITVDWFDCPMPEEVSNCRDTVHVESGQPIMFDTRLAYANSSCQCRQEISQYNFVSTLSGYAYTCFSPTNCTSNNGNFSRDPPNPDSPYNFSLVLSSPTLENGTEFVLQVIGLRNNGRNVLTRFFTVIITPPSTSPPTTMSPTTMSPTTTPSTEPTQPPGLIVGSVVGSLALVVLVSLVILSIVVILAYRRWITRPHKGSYRNSQAEPVYADIEETKSNHFNRNSRMYSSGKGRQTDVDLSPTLESVSVHL